MLFLVVATVTRTTKDKRGKAWESTRQVPTFLLDGNIQGILPGDGEHAARVARDLLLTVAGEGASVHVTVTPAQFRADLVSKEAPVHG